MSLRSGVENLHARDKKHQDFNTFGKTEVEDTGYLLSMFFKMEVKVQKTKVLYFLEC